MIVMTMVILTACMRGKGSRPCDAGVDTSLATVGNDQYSADHDHNQDANVARVWIWG